MNRGGKYRQAGSFTESKEISRLFFWKIIAFVKEVGGFWRKQGSFLWNLIPFGIIINQTNLNQAFKWF
jgi:hypothetical protein